MNLGWLCHLVSIWRLEWQADNSRRTSQLVDPRQSLFAAPAWRIAHRDRSDETPSRQFGCEKL